jgi:predicted phosphodiesterase
MKKIVWLFVILTAFVCPINSATAKGPLDFFMIYNGPYLMHTTKTSVTVMWETHTKCGSEVLYGTEFPPIKSSAKDEKVKIHEVKLEGLTPQTKYFYQVRSKCAGVEIKSGVFKFETAVNDDSAYSFGVISDNQDRPWIFNQIAENIYAERPNFVLDVGDVVSYGSFKYQWHERFFHPARNLMARVPVWVAIGNHEENADWFYKYVAYPAPENYYSFDYGNAHFVMVDSNQDLAPGSEMYKFIDDDLSNTDAEWIFVAHHHPPYSSDENDYGNTYKEDSTLGDPKVKQLVPLYEKYGVDIVWLGHVHTYERTWPIKNDKIDHANGVVYIRSGGSGGHIEDHAQTRSWFTAKLRPEYNYIMVNIHQNKMTVMAYDIKGNLFDYVEMEK